MQKSKFHRQGQSNRGLNPQNLLQGLLHTLERVEKQYTLRQTVTTFKKNGGVTIWILRNEYITCISLNSFKLDLLQQIFT